MSRESDRHRPPATTVDGQGAVLPPAQRVALGRLRDTIRAAAPDAVRRSDTECRPLSNGPLLSFGSFAPHLSLFEIGQTLPEALKDELAAREIAGTTVRVPPDRPLPRDLEGSPGCGSERTGTVRRKDSTPATGALNTAGQTGMQQ